METITNPPGEKDNIKNRYDEIINFNLLTAAKIKVKYCILLLASIGFWFLLMGFWFYFEKQDIMSAMGSVELAGYLGLAIYAIRKPNKPVLTILIIVSALFALVIIIDALIDPVTLLKGIIWKIIVIVTIIKGIHAGKEVKELQGKLVQIESEKNQANTNIRG